MSLIVQFMSMQLGEQLATYPKINCLEFTFSEGGRNRQGGPVLAAKIGPAGPILAADRFFRYNGVK